MLALLFEAAMTFRNFSPGGSNFPAIFCGECSKPGRALHYLGPTPPPPASIAPTTANHSRAIHAAECQFPTSSDRTTLGLTCLFSTAWAGSGMTEESFHRPGCI